ncbi:MAG: cysteine synthase family protein [Thermodesulfobacteriota bacterium]
MLVVQDINDLIGQTPLLELRKLYPGSVKAKIMAKLELCNPTSIKDRGVYFMVREAVKAGQITPGTEVVEASSGNTGIALARAAATMGFKARIYMSELCSVERLRIMSAYGATIVLTPAAEHTRGARERAIAYCEANRAKTFFLNQHGNRNNGLAHEMTTGPELWTQTGGELAAMIIGLGTAGTFDGLSRYLKSKSKDIRIIAFEPAKSPVYAGGKQGVHRLIGIGPGFVTDNFKRSRMNLDEIIHVTDEDAYQFTRGLARKEGVLAGPTSGAAAWVAGEVGRRDEFAGKTIVCFFYDSGERYLSTEGLFEVNNCEKAS